MSPIRVHSVRIHVLKVLTAVFLIDPGSTSSVYPGPGYFEAQKCQELAKALFCGSYFCTQLLILWYIKNLVYNHC